MNWDAPAEVVDVYLGGPESVYAELASKGRIERLETGRYWSAARRSVVGPTAKSARPALADPRVDPLTRAWALGLPRTDGWPAAYAKLIDAYGLAASVGWREGSAQAAVARGESEAAIDRLDPGAAEAADSVVLEEWAAIRLGARPRESARAFLRLLRDRTTIDGRAEAETDSKPRLSFEAESLAVDLLGATLVDAGDELRRAVVDVEKAGSPDWAVSRLTPLPPWPPSSVEKLLSKEGEEGAALVETLAAQLAPEPGARLWLSQSWLRPRTPIDGEFLAELAAADEGRLAREPRFRAWLRAEWTQWARQRYRWVSNLTALGSTRILTSTRSSEP